MKAVVWALPLLLAAASCLPRKPPRREERLYYAPTVAPQRLSGAEVTGASAQPRSAAPPPITAASRASAASIVTDEFTGQINVTVRDRGMPPHGFTVVFGATMPGVATRGGFFVFSSYSPRWRYLDCHRVDMLADGAIVTLSESAHDGTVMRGGVAEHVTVNVGVEGLRAILSAREVRARVCNDAWTFTPRMIAGFADIRDRVFPPEPSGQPPDEPRSEGD